MQLTFPFVCLVVILRCTQSLIVPDEVPALLSLVYSNIPPIKKGTDSRLGWGFRLGDHADFQVIVELGPQTNTRPLGNEKDKDTANSKRNVPNNLRNVLYAQNQLLKKQKVSDTEGGKWLKSWSQMINAQRYTEPIEGAGEIDASLVIPPELEELYGKPTRKTVKTPQRHETTTQIIISTTDHRDALDNVDFE